MLSHADHIRLAWERLSGGDVLTALSSLRATLSGQAAAAGKPEAYHETLTWFFTLLIDERRRAGPAQESFEDFESRNPDLFADHRRLIEGAYSAGRLGSATARKTFLLPDRGRSEAPVAE